MTEWVNWSGSVHAPVAVLARPTSLGELLDVVRGVTTNEGRLHAEGSRWAFSAPAYCHDTVVDTSALNGFPDSVQRSVNKPDRAEARFLLAVEAGIKIRDLYRALAFDRDRGYTGPRPAVPGADAGAIWTLPVLGGAGGQSLAGAISTGTHGGDAGRPPLSDAVRSILLVIPGGRVLLLEPTPGDGIGVFDAAAFENNTGISVEAHVNTALFEAALVSVGRLGIVWAYVLEIVDETAVAIEETRTRSTWAAVRDSLAVEAAAAAAADQFLQVAVSPLRDDYGDHTCFVTRHKMVPGGHPTDPELEPRLPHVTQARAENGCALFFQLLGSVRAHSALATLPLRLPSLIFVPGALPILVAQTLEHLGHLGHRKPNGDLYVGADFFVDVLGDVAPHDNGWLVLRTVHAEIFENEQREHLLLPHQPWQVKGTRFEIADFYTYPGDTAESDPGGYRGDSIEVFFPVDPADPWALATSIEALLIVFDRLRLENLQTAAYFSIRFMARSRATLGLARWPLTCSVEVAALRGMPGNVRLLRLLREATLASGGVVHWGQQNDLDPVDVAAGFGPDLDGFREQVALTSGRLFSNRFTVEHGLDPVYPATWQDWVDLGHFGRGAAAVPTGFESGGRMAVFARTREGLVQSVDLDVLGQPIGTWRTIRPEPVSGRPTVFRGVTGRLELFSVDDDLLRHTYEEQVAGSWSLWNTKGHPPKRYHADRPVVSVAAHGDGRLEVFGKAGWDDNCWLAHCWAHVRDGLWSDVVHRGDRSLASMPSAANLELAAGQDILVVAATTSDGEIVWRRQNEPSDSAGWTDWQTVTTDFRGSPGGPAMVAAPGALHLFVVGPGDVLLTGIGTGAQLNTPWSFTSIGSQIDPLCRPSALFHQGRIWAVARTVDQAVLCWDFAPGTPPVTSRRLEALTVEDVALGGYPIDPAVQVVVRGLDGRLFGRRMEPSA